ncbi:MAG: hypothetical protein QNK37_21070 [Acidobacteriota bacterium]|nr:hypothetical protein [Acidobacteriota bacterium]
MTKPTPISIWQPQTRNGKPIFVRPPVPAYGDHHASRMEIPADKTKGIRRVCFFGESVAAGYLFAPHLTCARVLEDQLNYMADEPYEVIDFSRTNETLGSMAETVAASLQLQPDIIVLYGGNNWNLLETPRISPYFPDPEARKSFGAIWAEGGVTSVMEAAIHQQVLGAEAALQVIADTVGELPVYVLLPEVNLADWAALQPPILADTAQRTRWYTLFEAAATNLAAQNARACLDQALKLLAVDEGTCPTTYRLIGDAWLLLGESEKALRAYRAEVDSESYASLCFLGSPRAGTLTRKVLTRMCRENKWPLIDLPAIFAEHTGEAVTGRRLFLDYCHHTLEGIHLAMATVTAMILDDSPWFTIASAPMPEIPPEIEAVTWLGAAVHTAHRLPDVPRRKELLDHALINALQTSFGITETMVDLVEARATGLPAVLTEAQERNFQGPYRLLMQHGWKYNHLDIVLIERIAALLKDAAPALAERIPNILLHHRGLGSEPEELAHPFYLWEPLMQFYPEIMQSARETTCIRCPWPRTSFALICPTTRDVNLKLVARQSAGFPTDVRVNGHSVATPELCESWTRHRIRVPRCVLNHGINKLTIVWSPKSMLNTEPPEERLQKGDEAHLHPIFGEIFSLTARLD